MTEKPMSNKPKLHKQMVNKPGSDKSGERISCLVDGEINDVNQNESVESMLGDLLDDKEACQCWGRYHLISDTLKRNLPHVIDCQLSSRVMAELENEPTVLAPSPSASSIGKQMAGLAVAASVATVAVLGVQYMYKEDAMAPAPQVAQLQGKQLQGKKGQGKKIPINKDFIHRDIQTVTQTFNQTNPPSQHSAQRIKQYHPNLNKYLLNHNQSAARGVVQGVIPYARVITNIDVERIVRYHESRQKLNQLQSQKQSQIQR